MAEEGVVRFVRFLVSDRCLREEIVRVLGHLRALPTDQLAFGLFDSGDRSVVCISALPDDAGTRQIVHEQRSGRPCGVIMRTEDRQKWADLSAVHERTPLLFVVATGGPKEKFPSMFPGIKVHSVTDLDAPFDKRVAQYIFTEMNKTLVPATP